uniref:Ammonium transporter AmtB-like domain-containing protein n=1 Tax=Onchocerca volvulus TaxID=6282 RepID=A0A8R1XXI7_ONCVO
MANLNDSSGRKMQSRKSQSEMASIFHRKQFTIFAIFFQVLFLILFAVFGQYSNNAMPGGTTSTNFINTNYPLFQDVHLMTLVGMGFIMVFLRRYGLAALSINLLLTSHAIQWALIVRGFFSHEFANVGRFSISILDLITADFVAITVLITMGAVLGKLTPVQYMVMSAIEVPVAVAVEHLVLRYLKVIDIGRSMVIHCFGAYFGLAVAKVINKREMIAHQHEGSSYNSNIFAMIGTLFLWAFFPSFNSALAIPEDSRHRAILNSYLALCSSTVCTFLISQMLDHENKLALDLISVCVCPSFYDKILQYRFSMTHISNSVLAGGIAIGTVANIILEPFYALLIGCLGALVSVLGNSYIRPIGARAFGLHDTRGVGSIHGLPGILAGILGFVFTAVYEPTRYGTGNVTHIYPAMSNSKESREVFVQAGYQLAALVIILLVSIIGGAVTGLILRLNCFNRIHDKEFYSDGEFIEPPEDYDFTTRIISKIDHIELTEHTALNKESSSSVGPSNP